GSTPGPDINEVSSDGRSRRHGRRHEVRTTEAALPALEVAVRGRGAALARRQLVRIHAEAHGAAGLAPVEAGFLQNFVEPLGLGLLLHEAGAWHDHRIDVRRDFLALGDAGNLTQVLDAAVGAGADEDPVELDVGYVCPRRQANLLERALH